MRSASRPPGGPQAFFTGFGDSSITFELRAWTDQIEQRFLIRSELATAVYDAEHAAGLFASVASLGLFVVIIATGSKRARVFTDQRGIYHLIQLRLG